METPPTGKNDTTDGEPSFDTESAQNSCSDGNISPAIVNVECERSPTKSNKTDRPNFAALFRLVDTESTKKGEEKVIF